MVHELRYALRRLHRAPGFAISAIVALALGIGANTAVFSVVHGVLLKPLPYSEPDRLVRLYESSQTQGIERGSVSPGTFVEWRVRNRTLESAAIFLAREWLIAFGSEYEQLRGAMVSPTLFPMLGVAPVLGRTFRPEEQQAPPFGDNEEILIGYNLWRRRYGGRTSVLGETVRIEGRAVKRIVGVMPPGFDFPNGSEVWSQETFLRPIAPVQRQFRYHEAIGRLRSDVTLEAARRELAGLSSQLASEYPKSNAGWSARIEPLRESIVGSFRTALLIVLGVVGAVLLIACANVTNLMLARAHGRRHETAVRIALGAGPARLARQWLIESSLLAVFGCMAGVVVGVWATRILLAMAPPGIPRLDEVALNMPVAGFAVLVSLVTAVATGLIPALHSGGSTQTLSRGHRLTAANASLRRWLIAGQVAVTLVLVVCAVLLVRSFVALRAVDVGFVPAGVLTADLRLPVSRFAVPRPWFHLAQHYDALLADVRTIPGVQTVGAITGLPLTGEEGEGSFWMKDAPGASGRRPPDAATDQWKVGISIVTPDYFAAMGIPVLRGRGFADSDRFTERQLIDPAVPRPEGVAIINDAMAARFWPGRDPIGQSIVLFDDQTFAASRVIIGIAGSVRASALAAPPAPAVFLPIGQHPATFRPSLAIRTSVRAESLAGVLRERLRAFDSTLLVTNIRPLDDVVSSAAARPRFNAMLIGSFTVLALILAAVGIYGVVAYLVTERTREMGIRLALGARRRDLLRLVIGDGLRPVVLGLVAGSVAALAVVRTMRGLLFEISPADPVSFVVAPLVLFAVATAAALIPARRATRVDPLVALREE